MSGFYHGQPNPQLSRSASVLIHEYDTRHMPVKEPETVQSLVSEIKPFEYSKVIGTGLIAGAILVPVLLSSGIIIYKLLE